MENKNKWFPKAQVLLEKQDKEMEMKSVMWSNEIKDKKKIIIIREGDILITSK